ncbi:radical SAM superfamily enzyme YgiQ (UPF0313 family) [Bacilli bacterium PM5-3]|nr:radical SAM superfamily enzyme YgiQ (UPF0313 family) [Bacilli bacterium PM5-3]MDH6603278.1 radical SAM superfamily enzyme YgiQ (UPF0313 family) [Bacilli bacterium PM5-9]
MNYEGAIFRPPSEAYSLLLQVTIGCSHNECTFCSMYKDKKFRIRELSNIIEDIQSFQNKMIVEKVFLCDGDALVLPNKILVEILKEIKNNFPNCRQVSSYATFQDVERKSISELKELYDNGLTLLYLGAESGSDEVLKRVNKGISAKDMVLASKKAKEAKMKLSVMIISGLGGQELFNEHALASAKLINEIDPNYFGLLSLMVEPSTKLYQQVQNKEFLIISPLQTVEEVKTIVSNLNLTNCIFSSSHVSNYINLKGTLPNDKNRLLQEIDYYLNNPKMLNYGYKGL